MIKVFKATDKTYATHGDLILNPTKAMVHKEDNGAFYFDLETPLDEKEYKGTAEAGTSVEGTSLTLTDVDATKNAEITFLKGQTSQSSTPTPSSPVPVETTTGEQIISIPSSTNLFNKLTAQKGYYYGASVIQTSNNWYIQQVPVQPNTKYYLSGNNYNNTSARIVLLDSSKNYISVVDNYKATSLITTTSTTTYIGLSIADYSGTGDMDTLMLNVGESALPYEEFKTNYVINLGKNLYYGFEFTKTNNGIEFTYDANGGITCEGIAQGGTANSCTATEGRNHLIILEPNTKYTLSGGISSNVSVQICDYNENVMTTTGATSTTFTTSTETRFYLRARVANGTDLSTPVVMYPQLQKGETPTDYAPYKTPIELCKISTYQDYIFKNTPDNPYYDNTLNENEWYLHKEVGKVVLNGSESWADRPNYNTWDRFVLSTTTIPKQTINGYSNYFKVVYSGFDQANVLYLNAGTQIGINFSAKGTTTLAQFKTWLQSHNVSVYYVLNTPTNTLIEDEELINQLESLSLLNGLNNISVTSANQPAILGLHYNFKNAYSNTIKYIDYLVPNNILVANTPQGNQAFRISNVEKTRRKIKIKANHVFYDSANLLIEDSYVVDKNCNDALDHLNSATSDTSPFTTISNVNHIDSYRCVRKSLYEAVQVVIERWGGHLTRDNWTFGIYDTIGQDNGVTIRYAKNLKDISATYDWNDVVTKLLPVGKDGILLNELDPDASLYVESATQYEIPYTKTVSFEQNNIEEDDYKDADGELDEDTYKQALIDDLYSKAMEYITNNYLPKVNYTLQANVEKVSDVGDAIEVIDEKLGINIMTNIISYDYDCILNRYTQLEFGNFKPTLSSLMTQISATTTELINENNETLQITLGEELEQATDKIWNALGNSYVIYEGDKILVVDALPKETATNVIMINNGGIAFSNSGINGTFSSAWTIDNVLNMEQINVINLTADLIKGGTLKLGSNLNQNGRIEVFDEANTLIAELNKDGLKMYGNDGSYVLMNNQVGFAGYDKNDTPIYWVSRDEFHMKKASAEEEITLVGKVRIIPITIRDANNQIVNDGIGFVNVGGGV